VIAAVFNSETVAALAAFLSGMGSVLTGWLALRYERKRSSEECEKRIKALEAGMRLRDRIDQGKPLTDEGATEI
jgi:hypothetical protein